jgi:hypothetical protein
LSTVGCVLLAAQANSRRMMSPAGKDEWRVGRDASSWALQRRSSGPRCSRLAIMLTGELLSDYMLFPRRSGNVMIRSWICCAMRSSPSIFTRIIYIQRISWDYVCVVSTSSHSRCSNICCGSIGRALLCLRCDLAQHLFGTTVFARKSWKIAYVDMKRSFFLTDALW